jgi:hypothetical protein
MTKHEQDTVLKYLNQFVKDWKESEHRAPGTNLLGIDSDTAEEIEQFVKARQKKG